MQIINFINPLGTKLLQTSTSEPISLGATSIDVFSTTGAAASTYILVENIGNSSSEIVELSTVSSPQSITNVATQFSHPGGVNVYYNYPYNIARVYKSTTGIAGPFTLFASGAITPSSYNTIFTDTTSTGTDNAYYTTG